MWKREAGSGKPSWFHLDATIVKSRLDRALVDRHLAATRARAQDYILAGRVTVDGKTVTKCGATLSETQEVRVLAPPLEYVSRAGHKLAAALDRWQIDLSDRVCLDIGTSTGGFADCMLRRGARLVFGVENGHGQLAASLRTERRMQLLERANARHLTPAMLPPGIDFFAMDVSFISATLVLPAVIAAAFAPALERGAVSRVEAVILIKPQFEAGRAAVGKHGIVTSRAAQRKSIERVRECLVSHGARLTEWMESPILGGDGNREFLLYARWDDARP